MDKVNKENNTSGHMQLDLTYDEVNLLRECMKRGICKNRWLE